MANPAVPELPIIASPGSCLAGYYLASGEQIVSSSDPSLRKSYYFSPPTLPW